MRYMSEGERAELSWGSIRISQEQDPWIQAIQLYKDTGLLSKNPKWSNWIRANEASLINDDGIWFRTSAVYAPRGKPVTKAACLLVPQNLRKTVLKKLHKHPVLGHKGTLATYEQLKSAYFWENMYSDCQDYVAQCYTCQAKSKPHGHTQLHAREIPELPFRVLSVDHAGPYDIKPGQLHPYERETAQEEKTNRGRRSTKPRYCLIIVDTLARFPMLIPVPDTRAQTTIRALEERLYPHLVCLTQLSVTSTAAFQEKK